MDIMNIQALIAQGLITDVASVDPNKAYVAVGVFQPGNRPSGSANANSYPSYAMPISEFLAAVGVYTASNGVALVGNDFQLASLLVSQFTNDANYTSGTGTIGYIPRWNLTDTLGNSIIFDDGLGNVGIGTTSLTEKLTVDGNIKITTLANKYKIGAYDALSITQNVGSPNIIIGHSNTMNDASNGGGIVIGTFATSSSDGIAIGFSSVINVGTEDGIAIGRATAIAGGVIRGLAIGREATSTADNAWAIGNYVVANNPDTIIIGANTLGNKQKVGVNITSPLFTFSVKPSANLDGIILQENATNFYGHLGKDGTKGFLFLYDGGSPKVAFNSPTYGSGFDYINTGQNLAIGLNIASAKVHIYGDATAGTYALKVNNLAFNPLLYVRNDGFVSINQTTIGAARLEITGGAYQGIYVQTTASICINANDTSGIAVKGAATTGVGLQGNIGGAVGSALKLDDNVNGVLLMKVGSNGTKSIVNIVNLPTSVGGLVAGDLWNNAGVINIV